MPHAPIAARRPVTRSFHGRDFVDNYEWLRDKESPDTREYLEAENAYTKAQTAEMDDLTETVYNEIVSRIKQTDMSVPVRAGDWWYYGRIEDGQSYGKSCRYPVAAGSDPWTPPAELEDPDRTGWLEGEEIILDVDEMAKDHEFFSLGASSVTTSGRFLAYSVDTTGNERFDLYVKDLTTGKLLSDRLEGIFYGATWVGEEYIFYQRVDEAWRPDTVWRHRIGTSADEDVLVYKEDDGLFSTWIGGTRSEKYLVLETSSKITSEIRVLDTSTPEGEFELLWPRETGVEYSVDHAVVGGTDRWIVTHNATGANFSVGECEVAASGENMPSLSNLHPLMEYSDTTRVEGVDVFRDQIVFAYRRGAIGRIALMPVAEDFGQIHEIEFDEELYSAGVSGNPEWDAPVLRMGYTSFTTPSTVFDYVVATGERRVRKVQEVGGDYQPQDYVAQRVWVSARDGAQVPVSVVYRRDLDISKPNPMLLYGYGAYESSTDPGFSVSRLSLLDRGMIFAIAHVRGGGEMGRGWYDNGKMLSKKNTFTDFIDVAQTLVEEGWTTPDHLIAEGGSAGGMLVGAVANMAPDLFKGILAIVPFVDSLTSMLMPELPLTIGEWEEWGDPYHDPEVYDYMASYSAYENVAAQDYPDILAVTSLHDTRVLYVEPAKWIAALRATATGGQFLLKTDMSAGHGGVSGRYDRWRQTAFEYAWVLTKGLEKL